MTAYTFLAGGHFAGSLLTLGHWRAGVLPRVVRGVMAAQARPCLVRFVAAVAKEFQSLRFMLQSVVTALCFVAPKFTVTNRADVVHVNRKL